MPSYGAPGYTWDPTIPPEPGHPFQVGDLVAIPKNAKAIAAVGKVADVQPHYQNTSVTWYWYTVELADGTIVQNSDTHGYGFMRPGDKNWSERGIGPAIRALVQAMKNLRTYQKASQMIQQGQVGKVKL